MWKGIGFCLDRTSRLHLFKSMNKSKKWIHNIHEMCKFMLRCISSLVFYWLFRKYRATSPTLFLLSIILEFLNLLMGSNFVKIALQIPIQQGIMVNYVKIHFWKPRRSICKAVRRVLQEQWNENIATIKIDFEWL